MLIHENYRTQFYEELKEQGHCLVLVNTDVDALCAWSILQSLFRCDEFSYSVLAVADTEDFKTKVEEHSQTSKTLLMINCGGNRALSELEIPSDCRLFIIDSRRPIHHENVYAEKLNVRIAIGHNELEKLAIPSASDIFEFESDSEEEDEDGEYGSENYDRRPRNPIDKIEKRIAKAEKATGLLWNYYKYSSYSISSAVLMFLLANECSKLSPEAVWCAGVGLTSQLMDCLISIDFYYEVCIAKIGTFLRKYAPPNGLEDRSGQLFRMKFAKELTLPFYSHWSIYESMMNDDNFVIRNQMWSQKGRDRLHHSLAALGLTLLETKQVYSQMDKVRRSEVFGILYEDQYAENQADFSTFTAQYDYSKAFNAADFARSLAGRLERGVRKLHETSDDRFRAAAVCLERFMNGKGSDDMSHLVEIAKTDLHSVVDLAIQTVKQQNVTPSGKFILVRVGTVPETQYLLSSRHALFTFTRLVQNAYAHKSAHKDRRRKPLIFAIGLGGEQAAWTLITGLMPLDALETKKSILGQAFKQTIDRTKVEATKPSFDPTIILLNNHHRMKFLDGLQGLL